MFQFVLIVLVCVVSAAVYGIVQAQVTVRVCAEYFTVGHQRLLDTDSPAMLALVWGPIQTVRLFGLLLGILLAAAARLGSRPKLDAREVIAPVLVVLGLLGFLALSMGLVGYYSAEAGKFWLREPLAEKIPKDKHSVFIADVWAHNASYLGGSIGAVALAIYVWRKRGRLATSRPRVW